MAPPNRPQSHDAATEPLWWRIFWPIGKWTFLALAATVLVLDVLLIWVPVLAR